MKMIKEKCPVEYIHVLGPLKGGPLSLIANLSPSHSDGISIIPVRNPVTSHVTRPVPRLRITPLSISYYHMLLTKSPPALDPI